MDQNLFSIYGAYGLEYIEKGFSCCPALKKAIKIPEWQKFSYKKTTKKDFERFLKFPDTFGTNICIVLGEASNLIGVDIDSYDDNFLEAVFEKIKNQTPVAKKGAKGATLFFRYNPEIQNKILMYAPCDLRPDGKKKHDQVKAKIEILTNRQQTIIPPSIHPDTNRPYEWIGISTLLDVDVNDLPKITVQELSEIKSIVDSWPFIHEPKKETSKDKSGVGARNENLKQQASAAAFKGKAINEIAQEIYEYDKNKHKPRLFLDQSEGYRGLSEEDAIRNATKFASSIIKSVSQTKIEIPKLESKPSKYDLLKRKASLELMLLSTNDGEKFKTLKEEKKTLDVELKKIDLNKKIEKFSSPNPFEGEQKFFYDDYKLVFDKIFKQDIFCDIVTEIEMWRKDGEIIPIRNKIDSIRSLCIDEGLPKDDVSTHLGRYLDKIKKELKIKLPEWDGKDRIGIMANCVNLKDKSKGAKMIFEDYLRAFMANIFRFIYDENAEFLPMIILQGGQGIGKDVWFEELFYGLGEYYQFIDFSNMNRRDLALELTCALVVNIPEIDKLHPKALAALKSFMTQKHISATKKFAADPATKKLRVSYVGSMNPLSPLGDSTGGRRFAYFKVNDIDWSYEKGASEQVLAQAKDLYEKHDYKPDKSTIDYIKGLESEFILEDVDSLIYSEVVKRLLMADKSQHLINVGKHPLIYKIEPKTKKKFWWRKDVQNLYNSVANHFKVKVDHVANVCNSRKLSYRTSKGAKLSLADMDLPIDYESMLFDLEGRHFELLDNGEINSVQITQ